MMVIKLTFSGTNHDVPIQTRITRRLMRAVEAPMASLRAVCANRAMNTAVLNNVSVLELMGANGSFNPKWEAGQRASLLEMNAAMSDEDIAVDIGKRFIAELSERFPAVYHAMLYPISSIDINDEDAVTACIELIKIIIDTTQLTAEEKEALNTDEFWDEQDLTKVVACVNSFRDLLQFGDKKM